MCGIMIGTGAIVSMVSFTVGMRSEMSRTIESSGLLTTIYVWSSNSPLARMTEGGEDPDEVGARDSKRDPDEVEARDAARDPDEVVASDSAASDSLARGTASDLSAPATGGGTKITDELIDRIASIKGVKSAFPLVTFPTILNRSSKQAFAVVAGIPSSARDLIIKRLDKGEIFTGETDSTLLASASLARRLGINPDSIDIKSLRTGIPVTVTIVSLGGSSFSPLAVLGLGMPFERKSFHFRLKGVLKESFFGPIGRSDGYIPLDLAKGIASMTIQDPSDILRNPSLRSGGYLGAEVHVGNLNDIGSVTEKLRSMNLATFSIADQLKEMRTALVLVSAFLGAIGGVALFVGCLGIVNIMLISVLERTREIGIMKSVGARRRDILDLFVSEAALIGLAGGVLGVLLGWVVAEITNHAMFALIIKNEASFRRLYEIPFWLSAGAVGLAIAVSVLAGLYPARRAASLEPTAALRYE